MPEHVTLTQIVVRIALAGILAALVGWDRERHEKTAGVRTMALVSVGAAAFMILGIELTDPGDGPRVLDSTRIAAGVIGGIGFIGAGSIIQAGGNVRGLTTAATIWASAAIGLGVGAGQIALAVVLTVMVLTTLIVVNSLKRYVLPREEPDDQG